MDVRNGRSLSMDSVEFKLGKTSKFQIMNILFWTMDLKFLESVIVDYLIWVESYTVYVVWIHNTYGFLKITHFHVFGQMSDF